MKNTAKKFLSLLLAAMMIFGAAAAGAGSVDFADIGIKAEAAETFQDGYFSYIVDEDGGAVIVGISSILSGSIDIPSLVGEYWVTGISFSSEYDYSDITKIVIPYTVTKVQAFGLSNLVDLSFIEVNEFNNNYYSDDDGVLFSKDKLHIVAFPVGSDKTNYEIPETVNKIDSFAFAYCENLLSIKIPNSVVSIGDRAFLNCSGITNIDIPDSVTFIDSGAFSGCSGLVSVEVPSGVTNINDATFSDCTRLANIIIPDSLKFIKLNAIKNTAYYNDESNWENGVLYLGKHLIDVKEDIIGSYEIKNGTISISECAFHSCEELSGIIIPDSVANIGREVFFGCTVLTEISIGNGVESIGRFAFAQTSYYNDGYNWENGILYIGKYLIEAKEQTDFCAVREGTRLIADYAFINSKLHILIIPCSLNYIGEWAFEVCDNLAMVNYKGSEEDWNKIIIGEYNYDLVNTNYNYNYDNGEKVFTITWIIDGTKTTQKYEAGTKITPPANPTKSGYTFKGWNPSVPETMPEKDMTFTAVFEKNVYTATWVVDGVKTTHKYEFGAKITAPANPTKSGYVFKGWSPAVPAAMPANDMTFTAVFEKAPEKNIYNLGEETYNFQNPNIYTDYYRCEYGAGGHCFGMSVTSSGYYIGELDITSAGGKKGQDLYDLTLTPDVQHPICYYQAIQGEFSKNATVAGGSWYLNNHKYNTNSDWNEVVNYVKNHAYDGKGTLQIGVRNNEGGHAVNFLRYEEVNGQARIYAYDNNFPAIETYFYMDSSGYIQQAPKSAFDEGLRCIALRSMTQYFELAGNYDSTRYIYAEKDTIAIKGATAYIMDGTENGVEYVMYGVPANAIEVTVTPLVDYAEFTYVEESYSFGALTDDTFGTFKLASSNEDDSFESEPSLTIHNAGTDASISIKSPSTATISYGDSIILHAEVENLPKGGKIVWESDNSCFALSASADGTTCTISPAENGSSTITATVVDADGNEVDSDSQTMTAKAGFFQKIIAFFKSLFGLTKVIPEAIKF